jgi:chromosome segregation ATPase
MKKLKFQIKSVRLSLAETQGRLAVTEKDLSTTIGENAQLRSENSNLRVGLTKAETVAKKSEDELALRRQEAKTKQTARPSSGPGAFTVGLLLSLVIITGLLAVMQFGQGEKLRTILSRQPDQAADKRHEQLSARLKQEQQRAERLDEEIKLLRAATADSQANGPVGGKREKPETMRRELREARAAAEAEKRLADERIQKMETELALITADKRQTEERLQKLEPELTQLAAEKQQALQKAQQLEPEVAHLTAEKADAEERARKIEPELAQIAAERQQLAAFKQQLSLEKQQALELVGKLERDLVRISAERAEAQERVQQLEPEVLVLRTEKLRLQRHVAKAHERLTLFGHEEPEETPPPFIG